MVWLKGSDGAGTHPRVMAIAGYAAPTPVPERDVALNEVFGWLYRCAHQSAAHLTDYLVDDATARMLGGARTDRLIALAKKAGLMSVEPRRRGEPLVYRLIEDGDLFHIRSRAEIEWERQRKRDNSNQALTMPVKARDGDACRYCASPVYWLGDRKSKRAGTYDHRVPGQPATVDTLVVSCSECNGRRGNDPAADDRLPLLPVPVEPYYSPSTAAQLTRYFGRPYQPTAARPSSQLDTVAPPQRPADQADTAPTAARPSSQLDTVAPPQRPADQADTAPTTARPSSQLDTVAPPQRPADQADTAPTTARPSSQLDTVAPPQRPADQADTAPTTARPSSQLDTVAPPQRPADQADTAPTTARPSSQLDTVAPPQRPADQADTAPPPTDLQIPADHGRSEAYGPGRDGSGREPPPPTPTGRSPDPPSTSPAAAPRRTRARRGRRPTTGAPQ